MLKTRQIVNYTLQTGRDIFDDMEQLDRHAALHELGKKNEYGRYLSEIIDGLYVAGVDLEEVDFLDILKPTNDKQDEDAEDFVPDIDPITRSRARFKKESVIKTVKNWMLSDVLRTDILLDAPFDVVVELYNEAVKERNKQQKRR